LSKSRKGLVVAGTDTAVGKTLVCGGLAAALRGAGVDVGVMKPVESGCRVKGGDLVPEDALFLRRMSKSEDAPGLINQYAMEQPLAPALAASIEGVDIRMEVVVEAFLQLWARHDVVLVEGAGGLLSPLGAGWSLPDLAKRLEAPVFLVARNCLGTISQCLLALYHLRKEGIPLLGVVLNQASSPSGLAEKLNPDAIRNWGKAPVLGVVPFLERRDDATIAKAVKEALDMEPIMAWLRS